MPISPTYLHKNSHSSISSAGGFLKLAPGVGASGGLRGIGPAFAGNVGTGGAFALTREGGGVSTFQCSLRPDPAAAIAQRRGVVGPTQFPFPDEVPRQGARPMPHSDGLAGCVSAGPSPLEVVAA
jgi:hypothetical protein